MSPGAWAPEWGLGPRSDGTSASVGQPGATRAGSVARAGVTRGELGSGGLAGAWWWRVGHVSARERCARVQTLLGGQVCDVACGAWTPQATRHHITERLTASQFQAQTVN